MNSFKLGICQMEVSDCKQANIEKAVSMLESCKQKGTDIAVLPEMFNCPYDNSKFELFSEKQQDGETIIRMSQTSRSLGMYIIAGSIPEYDNGKIFNTSFIFDKKGNVIGRHRKVHLFDINIPDGIIFRESDVLSPGSEATVVRTEFGSIGIAICFDIRFPDLYNEMCLKGAQIFVTPAAFNMVTGPAHWETLIRSRAIDNQAFHAAASPARKSGAGYIAYGHSMITDPWGKITVQADEKEQILIHDIDLDEVKQVRARMPVVSSFL